MHENQKAFDSKGLYYIRITYAIQILAIYYTYHMLHLPR